MQQTRAAPPATLDAVLERITYANQETGYMALLHLGQGDGRRVSEWSLCPYGGL